MLEPQKIFSEQALFDRIVEEGRMQGITEEGAYHELVESVIEDLREDGGMHDDQNLVGHGDALKVRFDEYLELIGEDGEMTL